MGVLRRSVVAAGCGYVAGMFPSAAIVARGIDLGAGGTGNPGAANVANLLGKRAGATVFALDLGKAVIAGQLGRSIAGATGANIAASGAVLGHCYPAASGFKGGKGVSAGLGQMLATFPAYLPVDIALGVVAAKSDFWKKRPVATIGATCSLWIALAGVWSSRRLPNLWGPIPSVAMPIAAAVSSVAIVSRFAAEQNRLKESADPEPQNS